MKALVWSVWKVVPAHPQAKWHAMTPLELGCIASLLIISIQKKSWDRLESYKNKPYVLGQNKYWWNPLRISSNFMFGRLNCYKSHPPNIKTLPRNYGLVGDLYILESYTMGVFNTSRNCFLLADHLSGSQEPRWTSPHSAGYPNSKWFITDNPHLLVDLKSPHLESSPSNNPIILQWSKNPPIYSWDVYGFSMVACHRFVLRQGHMSRNPAEDDDPVSSLLLEYLPMGHVHIYILIYINMFHIEHCPCIWKYKKSREHAYRYIYLYIYNIHIKHCPWSMLSHLDSCSSKQGDFQQATSTMRW